MARRGGHRLRLFLAVDIPDAHKKSLDEGLHPLRLRLPAIRWIPPERWHATLKFLGEVEEERIPTVVAIAGSVASETPRGAVALGIPGAFPRPAKARVLWVGLSGDVLRLLAQPLEKQLGVKGFRKEKRSFKPHLTIARLAGPMDLTPALGIDPSWDHEPFPVEEMVLYRSKLGPRPEYEALERFTLAHE